MCTAFKHTFIALAVGVAVTVATAWACSLWMAVDRVPLSEGEVGAVADRLGYADERAFVRRAEGFGISEYHVTSRGPRMVGIPIPRSGVFHYEVGWPLRVLAGSAPPGAPPESAFVAPACLVARPTRFFVGRNFSAYGGHRILPTRLKPAGLVINSVFFAMLAWVAFRAPLHARRLQRRRRGACEFCGYPRGSSFVCTECGQPSRRLRRIACTS